MSNRDHSIVIEVVALCLVLVAAMGFYWKHVRQPYSEPAKAASALMVAAEKANLGGFRDACVPAYYQSFVRHFGEQKYRRTESIFNAAYRHGEQRWWQYRLRANELAQSALRRLHEKAVASGKEAFTRLGVEERMKLIENRSDYAKFLAEAGKKALSGEERSSVEALEAFLKREETEAALAQVWALMSEEDRKALGAQGALSSASTPEKLAFIDAVGIPQLPEEMQTEIKGIQRWELALPDAFKFKYGEPLAEAFLKERRIRSAAAGPPCAFPKQDNEGSYLRGEVANCTVLVVTPSRSVPIGLTLKKVGFKWLVAAAEPEVYNIAW